MTDPITPQNTDLYSWITLYMYQTTWRHAYHPLQNTDLYSWITLYVPDYMASCLSPPLTFPRELPCTCPRLNGVMPILPPEYWSFLVNRPIYVPDYMASCLSPLQNTDFSSWITLYMSQTAWRHAYPPPEYWLFLVNHPVYIPDYMASWSPSW